MKIDKKKIICLMIDAGLNNQELSARSGVSITRVSNIKNGQNTTYETACKIANTLGVSVTDLIEESDSQKGAYL